MAASDKYYHGEITSDDTDWGTGDASTENKPCGGDAVQAYIKRKLKGKAGEFYYDQDTNMYLIFSDEKDRDAYLSDREGNADLLLGRFDAPANYTAEISMITPAMNVILSGQTGNKIQYTFDIKNKNGASTMEPVVATYTFNNAGNIQKITQIYNAGTTVEFLIDSFLGEGANSISVLITGRSSLASTMTAVNFTVVNLKLSSDFDFAAPVPYGGNISITYQLSGSNLKYLEWYVDGTLYGNPDSIADFSVTRTKAIPTSNLTVGKHNIQARAYINNNDTKYYSKTLYYDVVVAPSDGAWDSAKNFILLGLTLEEPRTSGVLSVAARQYEELPYKIATYNSTQTILEVTVKDGSTVIQTIAPQLATVQSMTYTPATDGTHTLTFVAGTDSVTVSAIVSATDVDIEEQTDGLLLKLTADGRSNSETNPATWTDRGITTLFNNFVWNGQSGWHDGRLVVPSGSSITVGIKPLASISKTTGKTIEIDYETSDITNEEANIINVVSGGAGLNVKPSSARLQSAAGVNVNTRYRAGDRVHLSFIINPSSGPFANLAFIVNNGILERASRFDPSDTFASDNYLSIGKTDGTAGCTIKIKSLRVYDKALTPDEAFCNYAIDSGNLIEIANRNNIYGEGGGIDADKVNANIPIMIITGNIDNIMQINDKARKGEWNTYPVDIEYRNLADPSLNFTIEQADIRLQGTSSISYPRKNFRIYSKSKSKKYNTIMRDANGEVVEGGKYSFKHGSAPVTCWCLKADYAESSGSHNTGVARMWNKLMYNAACSSQEDIVTYGLHPLRTKAQTWADENHYPYDVRTTIDGFPIVLFQRETENSPLTCFGQYNFNNDKSTEDVYGFTELSYNDSTFDNSKVQCFEVLDSDNEIALFKNVSNFDSGWSDAFEGRYPDGTEDVAKLKAFCQWVNSCKNNLTKWKNEKANHLDLPKLAAYYVYLLRFGAVDQTVKNAMLTTEDGEHFFFINYDNDTILGIDNASVLFDTWDYDLKSTNAQGGYYYAGRGESVLWNMFEADNECLALARKMDKLLYQAGLRYSEVCKMFDDEQSSQWCERIYNENGRYKYIEQAQSGANVLYMLQGSRKSYRHWWLQHRFDKYDNMWGGGSYTERLIQVRASSQGEQIHKDSTYTATAAITSYFGYALASTEVDPPTKHEAGETFTSTGLPQETLVGNLIYIYNADNLSMINVSGWLKGMGTLDVSKAVDVVGESRLRKLILGDGSKTNLNMTDISGLGKQKGLEELDIRGCKGIITLSELSTLTNLHVFNAANSGLTTFRPADGATLTSVTLPSTLQTLELNSNAITTLNYTPDTTLRNMTFRNVTGINTKTFVENWLSAIGSGDYSTRTLELQGVDWTNVDVDWLCGLAEKEWSSFRITGHAKVSGELTDEVMTRLKNNFGSGCFSETAAFYVELTPGLYVTAPASAVEGSSVTLRAQILPTPTESVTYMWSKSGDGRATLSATTGSEVTLNVSETGAANGTAQINVIGKIYTISAYSAQKTVTIVKATYPTAAQLTLNEDKEQRTDSRRVYNVVSSVEYTGILSGEWSLTGDITSYATLTGNGLTAVLDIHSNPIYVTGTLQCVLKKFSGATLTTKTLSVSITDDTIAITKAENPYLMALMYEKFNADGKCAHEDYMTKAECALITDSDLQPGSTSSTTIFRNNANFRTKVTTFHEFQYFTGLTKTGPWLFFQCYFSEITLPPQILTIDGASFSNCLRLRSISIPDSVATIGESAFEACSSLHTIHIPASVTRIYSSSYTNCPIQSVSIDEGNGVYETMGVQAIVEKYTKNLLLGVDVIPDGVTTIMSRAFYGRTLKSIVIPDAVTSMGDQVFYSCRSLESITIGRGIKTLGSLFFAACVKLKTIISLPETAPAAHSSAFGGNVNQYIGKDVSDGKVLYVPAGATGYDTSYWGSVLLNSSKCNFTLQATL